MAEEGKAIGRTYRMQIKMAEMGKVIGGTYRMQINMAYVGKVICWTYRMQNKMAGKMIGWAYRMQIKMADMGTSSLAKVMNERSYTSIPPICLHGMHRGFTLIGSTGSRTVWEDSR
jgi:hypothetical protein